MTIINNKINRIDRINTIHNMDTIRHQIYLGALLHDIGKFMQRADNRLLREIIENEGHLKKITDLICPFNEETQNWGYQHSLWAYLFFLETENKDRGILFNSVKENNLDAFHINPVENKDTDNLLNFSIFHHKPFTKLQAIIQLADCISSGIERGEQNAENPDDNLENDAKINYGKYRYKKVPLFSLFNEILIENNRNKENLKVFPLSPLNCNDETSLTVSIENDGFKEGNDITKISENYKILWDKFSDEIQLLPTDSIQGFSESLLYLLKRFTWCIPSSTNDMSNVSLFEHLKTTAAIAQCIYDYQREKGYENTITWEKVGDYPSIKQGIFPLLMVCWDLSGIQKFIYDISGEKASVSLKGRSFYLELLIETIIQKTITLCDTNWGNVIYSSGGKLFMLLPNLDKTKENLSIIKSEFEKLLWEEHQGKISICLGTTPFSFDTTINTSKPERILFEKNEKGSLSDLWKRTLESSAFDKSRKFESLFSSNLFTEKGKWGNNYTICAVTGIEGKKDEDLVKIDNWDTDENVIYVSKPVKKQKEIGDTLKDADFILTYQKVDKDGSKFLESKSVCVSFGDTGINQYLFDQKKLNLDNADFRKITSADVARVRRINETDFTKIAGLKGEKCSYGYLFYGGNKQAWYNKENRNKTFKELCWINQEQVDKPEKDQKTSFLGVLRMDVDNLGKIFINGIPDEHKSFASYATMSSMLDFFFSGYLNTIREKFQDYVNIIYSGGDDVFAVGRWDQIIGFAEEIRVEFQKFTGRAEISISGGIAIVGEKYPIRLAAEDSGKAEEASKDYKKLGNVQMDKNAITFFGETISWQFEWEEVKEMKNELKKLIEGNELSKAILHQLMKWKLIKDENQKGESNLSYRWHTAYYITRYCERISSDNEHAIKVLKKIRTGLFTGQGHFSANPVIFTNDRYYDLTALAARWAEMELKEFKH